VYELGTLSLTRPLQRFVRRHSLCGSGEFTNHLNAPNYVSIELGEVFGGHPQFGVDPTTDGLNGISTYELCRDLESRDIARTTFLDVPVTRDLNCILLVCDRIEDGLLRKPGRKLAPPRRLDKLELFGPTGRKSVTVSMPSNV